jgi:hypothetical protein
MVEAAEQWLKNKGVAKVMRLCAKGTRSWSTFTNTSVLKPFLVSYAEVVGGRPQLVDRS